MFGPSGPKVTAEAVVKLPSVRFITGRDWPGEGLHRWRQSDLWGLRAGRRSTRSGVRGFYSPFSKVALWVLKLTSAFCLQSAGILRNTQATLVWRTRELHATWTACYRRCSLLTSYDGWVFVQVDFYRPCMCPAVERCFRPEGLTLITYSLSLFLGGLHDAYRGRWLQQECSPGTAEGFLRTATQRQTCWYQEAHQVLRVRHLPALCWLLSCPPCQCVSPRKQNLGVKLLFSLFNGQTCRIGLRLQLTIILVID